MFKVELYTGGAAFHCEEPEMNPAQDRDVMGLEVARLLVKIATDIRQGKDDGSIIDLNGNKVGEWSLE